MADKSDEARDRAEAKFKKQEQVKQEGDKVWAERAASGIASDKLRRELRAQRLAKEATDKIAAPAIAMPAPKRPKKST